MDIIQLERDLTGYLARLLGGVVDEDIYQGVFPAGTETGMTVALGEEIRTAFPSLTTYRVRVNGRFAEREEALEKLHQLAAVLPRYELTAGLSHLAALIPENSEAPFPAADGGIAKYEIVFNLTAVCRSVDNPLQFKENI